MHTFGCRDQLQVSIWCQVQVANTPLVVGARTDSQGRGQLQAHWQLHYPGCPCTFTLLYNLPWACALQWRPVMYIINLPLRMVSSVQMHSWRDYPQVCTWVGVGCANLGWSLATKQPQRPGWLSVLLPDSSWWGLRGRDREGLSWLATVNANTCGVKAGEICREATEAM